VFEFKFMRASGSLVTADLAKPENAQVVLDAFLVQLTGA
jgi:hypothetical protein